MRFTKRLLNEDAGGTNVRPGATRAASHIGPSLARRALYKPAVVMAATASVPAALANAIPKAQAADIERRVRGFVPELERYVANGMAAFDVPGVAVGIVSGDRLLYAKGFGQRRKGTNDPVDARTVFQIGSTTKAFLAAMLALAVDRHKFAWNDRVVDLYPAFALEDPWVTREFRVYDLLAQRSGLPPYVNDTLADLGFDPNWMMHSLRFVRPTTSFRSTFTYTNITHLIAGHIAAKALGAPNWPALAQKEIIEPLGMHETSFTAEAIEKAVNHAVGHRWAPGGSVAIPFTPLFPYAFGPAGDINSTVEDCARWVRFQIGNGSFAGRRLVSTENLGVTHTPEVSINETTAYAMGWVVVDTPNGRVVWHNGGTWGFGAHIGFLPHRGVGAIVLSNQINVGFPDAVGLWIADKFLGNPETNYAKTALSRVKNEASKVIARFRKPTSSRSAPPSEELVGEYQSSILGAANLAATRGGLLLTLKKTGAQLTLAPFDGALFTIHVVPEGRFGPVAAANGNTPMGFANFEADSNGHLSRLHFLTDNGQGWLLEKSLT